MGSTVTEDPAAPPADGPARRSGAWMLRGGLLLILVGLVLLGYVGWQLYGTNVVSQRRHEAISTDLERAWRSQGTAAQPAGGEEGVRAAGSSAEAILRVPRFGDDYAVPVLEGVSDDVLASGVGHFEDSAAAGAKGNYALAAHRVTHGEPFRDMPELRAGDTVVVETRRFVYTYVLDTAGDALTVPFTETWVIGRTPVNPEEGGVGPTTDSARLITLTTCSELFHTDNRLIAFGHLEGKEKKGAAATGRSGQQGSSGRKGS